MAVVEDVYARKLIVVLNNQTLRKYFRVFNFRNVIAMWRENLNLRGYLIFVKKTSKWNKNHSKGFPRWLLP